MLSVHLPDLRSLELLLAVARTGSLGAAGRELGLTQQAVSARVRTVEQLVGVPVVHRGPRGSTLTGAGTLLVDWSTRVLTAAAELDAAISALRADRPARLAVAASATVAEHLLPGWLARLGTDREAAGRPPATVSLAVHDSDHAATEVLDGRAELGFVETPHLPTGLDARLVATDELVVVVPPGHAWARRSVAPAEIAAAPLVVLEADAAPRRAFEDALRAVAPAPHAVPAMELGATAAVRSAVLAGVGPGVLSDLAVRDDIATGRLHRVPVTGLAVTRELRVVWTAGSTLTGAIRGLVRVATGRP